jgi:hypothetical protein
MKRLRSTALVFLVVAASIPAQAEDMLLQLKASKCVMAAIEKGEYVAPPSKNKNIELQVDVGQTISGKIRIHVNGEKLTKAENARFSACASS